jgi:predicted metalloprotease with PDZ domain
VGPFTLSGVVADFTSDENGTMALPFVAGNVGGNIWRRFALTLDYNKLSMTLVPNDEYLAPDVYERAGLFLVNRDGKYVVLDARPGAAAVAAGIAKGDIIESINGVQAATMSLQAVRNLFLNAPGTRLTLGLINKDGIRRNATLTLRDLV